MLSFISKILSQHAFLRASHSRNAAYIRIPGYRRFSTLVCRDTSCFLSQHAFLRASHSRNAAYIRIPGYRCFSTLVCRNTSCFLSQHAFLRASHSRNAAYIRIPGYRPTCSCMFVLLIARALCLQAVTCPAIAELLRQVVPGGCVSSILTHAEVQMVAGGTSGGAHCGYRLSSDHNIVLGYI